MIYPTLLKLESPKVMVYSKESIISEKFEAMVSLSVFNSRMKDFYDIYTMAINEDFIYKNLKNAISETFIKRETNIMNYSVIFTEDFITDYSRIIQWQAFLKRINFKQQLKYSVVMKVLEEFLNPVAEGIIKKVDMLNKWDKELLIWI